MDLLRKYDNKAIYHRISHELPAALFFGSTPEAQWAIKQMFFTRSHCFALANRRKLQSKQRILVLVRHARGHAERRIKAARCTFKGREF